MNRFYMCFKFFLHHQAHFFDEFYSIKSPDEVFPETTIYVLAYGTLMILFQSTESIRKERLFSLQYNHTRYTYVFVELIGFHLCVLILIRSHFWSIEWTLWTTRSTLSTKYQLQFREQKKSHGVKVGEYLLCDKQPKVLSKNQHKTYSAWNFILATNIKILW